MGTDFVEDPPRSRVHQLAQLSMVDLVGLYGRLAMEHNVGAVIQQQMVTGTRRRPATRDHLITAIRDLEDPR
jgi:hypothetical protein